MKATNLSSSASFSLKHLISIENLNTKMIQSILDKAEDYFDPQTGQILCKEDLQGKTVANLFFEPSTRTRSTFELAAKRLSAQVLNLNIATSATTKGESLEDTVRNLEAMQCDIFVVRHPCSGAAQFIAQTLKQGGVVINAGDGCHAHPTQALLDMFTIRKHRGDFSSLCFAIIGDVAHSRVARSQIQALHYLGAQQIRIIGPKTLLPLVPHHLGVKAFHSLKEGLQGVDVIIMLRLQSERMQNGLIPLGNAFYREYGLTQESLANANPEALIIHPGPINRGVEIQSEIADSQNAVILDQVTNGIAIRMAIMSLLVNQRVR